MSCKIGTQCYIDSNGINLEEKTISVVLSDESKVIRHNWSDGVYHIILEHSEKAIDLRRKDILPVLLQHDTSMLPLGIYENVRIEGNKLKATARFDPEDALAMEVFGKMSRGFMKSFSVGVTIHSKELVEENKETGNVYRATRWEITEASIVTVPAIPTAKVGLSEANPTASGDNSKSNTGEANMEFNEDNFKVLLANKETLDKRMDSLKMQLETANAALENKDEELSKITQKLSEAEEKQKNEKEVLFARLNEASATKVGVDVALKMLSASSDEEASKIALEAKSNTNALHQGEGASEDKTLGMLEFANKNKGSYK